MSQALIAKRPTGILQLHFPSLADEIHTEGVVRLICGELEARAAIDATCGGEAALCPQSDLAVTLLAGEADALLGQGAADAKPARCLLDQKQPQLGDVVRAPDQDDRADRLAVDLGDPAMLARRIEGLDELGSDLGNQRLERDVPAVLLSVDRAMARDHPSDISGTMAAQQKSRSRRFGRLQYLLDRSHCSDQTAVRALVERIQHRRDLGLRAAIELGKGLAALGGEAELLLAAVGGQGRAADQALFAKTLDDAAEITGVEPERDADLLGRDGVALRKLVEHPRLGQGERALQQLLVEHAELARVEAVEGADGGDSTVDLGAVSGRRHGRPQCLPLSTSWLTMASIFCAARAVLHRPHCEQSDMSA